ncbi:hypothetical protein VTN02DRAFT_942 [Thermoascus thermophilus]
MEDLSSQRAGEGLCRFTLWDRLEENKRLGEPTLDRRPSFFSKFPATGRAARDRERPRRQTMTASEVPWPWSLGTCRPAGSRPDARKTAS